MIEHQEIARDARSLSQRIARAEPGARLRICHEALELGDQAVARAQSLSLGEIAEVQSALRLAYRESRGSCRTHSAMAQLAAAEMAQSGLTDLPVLAASEPCGTYCDTACLALAGGPLPNRWWHTTTALSDINGGRYMLVDLTGPGRLTVSLRLLEGDRRYLDPAEHGSVLALSPDFSVRSGGHLFFGAAERVTEGTRLAVEPGRYTGTIACLGSADGPHFVATLTAEIAPAPVLHHLARLPLP